MRSFLAVFLLLCAATLPLPAQEKPTNDRSRLPAGLRELPLERLSSGALMLLNRDGNLVAPPRSAAASGGTRAGVQDRQFMLELDPRVGMNIRLGDDPPELPSTIRSQAEPHIERSVTHPDFLAATFQEGRFTDGGAVDCGYSISNDGGLTWTRELIPNLTTAKGGTYFRATDPVVRINLAGHVFLNTLAATDEAFDTGVIVLSRSQDGGRSFTNPILVYAPANSTIFPDKNWMAVNNFAGTTTAGRIMVTFTSFIGNTSPITRTYSDDNGNTWSTATFVHGSTTDAQGSQPVYLPNGNLVIPYWNFGTNANPNERLETVNSTNGGNTFGAPVFITNVARYNPPNIRSALFLPNATGDRTTNSVYVVYQATFAGAPRVMFTKSTNSGASWSTPVPISDNPPTTGVFNPAIAASPDGQTLAVVFYDRRDNPGSNTLVHLYLAQSFDSGATWQPNIRLTDTVTDASLAPLTASGYMLGDYLGVAEPVNNNIPAVPVYIDTRTGNPDPFVVRVGIAPTATYESWQAARLSLSQINTPTVGGMTGDADGDTENNGGEFAAMTNPNDALYQARPLNISTRLEIGTGDNAGIGGFIITGTGNKQAIIRAIGPSLANFGIANALPDPTLELVGPGGPIAVNDDWRDTNETAIQNTGLAPSDDREAAILTTLAPGQYTAIVRGKNGATGIALVETYDLGDATAKLANLSTRGQVLTGESVMIGGVIVGGGSGPGGTGNSRLLLRGIGPSSGLAGALGDPTLRVVNSDGMILAQNNNWKETQRLEILATGIPPGNDNESAILISLPIGQYTAILEGAGNTTGLALVEAYDVD